MDQSKSKKRPGYVTFAAVLMFVVGGFHILMAISEYLNSFWLATGEFGWFGGSLLGWAIIDTVFAGIALLTGLLILQGQVSGGILGMVIAGLLVIRWLFYIPAAPVLAVVVIAINMLAIYGLAKEWEFFESEMPAI